MSTNHRSPLNVSDVIKAIHDEARNQHEIAANEDGIDGMIHQKIGAALGRIADDLKREEEAK